MSSDYHRGPARRPAFALPTLADEEKCAALLGESRSWRTNKDRGVRHKALRAGQTRIRTASNKLALADGEAVDAELKEALAKLGL